jgi:hypothetical protein
MADKPLLTLESAAKELGISRKALDFCIEAGLITAFRIGARGRRVPIAEIRKFREGNYGQRQDLRVLREEGNNLPGKAGSGD